jgi:hypothetical protein
MAVGNLRPTVGARCWRQGLQIAFESDGSFLVTEFEDDMKALSQPSPVRKLAGLPTR